MNFLNPWREWLQTVLSCGKRCVTVQMESASRSDFAGGFIINRKQTVMHFLDVAHVSQLDGLARSTQLCRMAAPKQRISLDACLRSEGIPELNLWVLVTDVLEFQTPRNRFLNTKKKKKSRDDHLRREPDHETRFPNASR